MTIDLTKWEYFPDGYSSLEDDRFSLNLAAFGLQLQPMEIVIILNERDPMSIKGRHGPYRLGVLRNARVSCNSPMIAFYLEIDRRDLSWMGNIYMVHEGGYTVPGDEAWVHRYGYLHPVYGLIYSASLRPTFGEWIWKDHILLQVQNLDTVPVWFRFYTLSVHKLVNRKTEEALILEQTLRRKRRLRRR